MSLPKLCIVFFVLCQALTVKGQSDIEAVILEDGTDVPVSYATIRIKGTNQGVIADYDGTFRLPFRYMESNTIILITSIGYSSKEIDVTDLKRDQLNVIYLKTQVEALDAVVINSKDKSREKAQTVNDLIKASRALTAYQIVQRAIKNIPENLSSSSHSYVGYYRDYQVVNNEYHNLNEAIVESFDQGINTNKIVDKSNNSILYSYKLNESFKVDTMYVVPYDKRSKFIQSATIDAKGGNELTILNVHNPIRNYSEPTFSFIYTLQKDFLNNHDVKILKTVFLDNEPIVKIMIEGLPKLTGFRHRVLGEIYISLIDYAIHRLNYFCYDSDKRNPLFNVNIEYKRLEEKMYLNYITFNNRFVMREENVLEEEKIVFDPDRNGFIITFNRKIDKETVSRKAFRIKYNKKKLIVKSATAVADDEVIVNVGDFIEEDLNATDLDMEQFNFNIKKIQDLSGREIYKPRTIIGYQFRELFVQEVFP
ncbi:MAG: carboxypeptidase-like regulatory domain-containing protein, partial [Bacteroidota bacterium]